jgi:hypothetical protein
LVIHLVSSIRIRAAIIAPRLGVLVGTRVARWWIPIFWSLVSALLWLRISLLKTGVMTFARFRCFLVWPGVWRFRAVVVVNHHFLPSVAQGLRIQLRGAAQTGSAISSTSGHEKAPFKDEAFLCQSLTRKIDRIGKYSLTFSLIAMAFCYAAQLSIKPSASSSSCAAVSASFT